MTRTAVGLWAVYLAVVCVVPLFKPLTGTIYPTYAVAGGEFAAGRPLYDVPHPYTDNYRYSPLVAAAFAPFAMLPMGVGGMTWRLLSAAVYLSALAAWAKRVNPRMPLAALFVCALPLSHMSLFNGQANAIVVGFLLWAAVFAADGRWSLAAGLVAAAALFKGYPVAFGLLLMLAAPVRVGVPLALAVAAGLALPYLFQSPEYVTAQYQYWLDNLSRDDRTHFPLYAGHQDFHMLLRVFGVEIPRDPYRFVQAGMGGLAAAVVGWQVWKGIDRPRVVLDAFTLAVCWMATFGPVVEGPTFILLAPVMARELVERATRPAWARWAALAGSGLFLVAVGAFAFPHHVHRPLIAAGIQPAAALLVCVSAVSQVFKSLATSPATAGAKPQAAPTLLRQAA
jgi:hypothetical protein